MSRKPTLNEVFNELYRAGVELRIGDDGRLKATHVTGDGCTSHEKKLIREHAKGLRELVGDDAAARMFSPTLKFIGKTLRPLFAADLGAREQEVFDRAFDLVDEAGEAFEEGDNGGARWLLHLAIEAAKEARTEYDTAVSGGPRQEELV